MSIPRSLVLLALSASLAAQSASFGAYGRGCPGSSNGPGIPDVVPQSAAATFGAKNNNYPFSAWPIRYQQVFLANELGGIPVYVALGLRQDDGYAGREAHAIDLEMWLGGTTRDPDTIGAAFDANFDSSNAPKTRVFARRTFALPMMPASKPTHPGRLFVTIPFDSLWLRSLGAGENLLIEVIVHGNTNNNSVFGYQLDAVNNANTTRVFAPLPATTGNIGRGYGLVMAFHSPGSPRPLALQASRPPRLGADFLASLLHAAPNAPGVLVVGTSDSSSGALSLPLSLGGIGAPGCWLLASTDVTLGVMANAGGDLSLSLPVPGNPFLAGKSLFLQLAMLDASNALGIVTSNGGVMAMGN